LLDAVSGGRFDLGVARGGPWIDLEVFGTGLARYTDGFAESLDLLLAALDGRPAVKADGEHFRFPEVAMVPRPDRPVPVWVAATSSSTVDLAARRRLPLLLGMHDGDRAKAAMLGRYTGPAGLPHASAHLAFVADTTEQAEKALRATMPGWLARTGEYRRVDDNPPRRRDLAAYLDHLLSIHPVGPPARCVDRLTATLDTTGVRRLLLMVEGGGDPDVTAGNIHRIGTEVVPALREHSDRLRMRTCA
jgi:alkanesulfonate monooxygenase SsuD/methylene tetrahydromethanopterin reductase-like flavin-dependent oxidoreductase (luciferase family)